MSSQCWNTGQQRAGQVSQTVLTVSYVGKPRPLGCKGNFVFYGQTGSLMLTRLGKVFWCTRCRQMCKQPLVPDVHRAVFQFLASVAKATLQSPVSMTASAETPKGALEPLFTEIRGSVNEIRIAWFLGGSSFNLFCFLSL